MHILCSSVFSFRARCKSCKGLPKYFFFTIDRLKFKDVKTMLSLTDHLIKKSPFNINHYLAGGGSPAKYYNNKRLWKWSYRPSHCKTSSSQYKACRLTNLAEDSIVDVISCPCFKTMWVYKDSSKASLKNRKPRFYGPTLIKFL